MSECRTSAVNAMPSSRTTIALLQIRLFQESARQLPGNRTVLLGYSDEAFPKGSTNPFQKRLLIPFDQNRRASQPEQGDHRLSLIEFAHKPGRPLRHHW